MSTKAFASQADLDEKKVSFTRLSDHAWAYTAEGDPNTGIVIGDDAVMVIDTQATPAMAQDVIRRIRSVTDKPIEYVVLSHYHAVRVLGASAYAPRHVIASDDTLALIRERGEQDKASEIGRFPRLFRDVQSVPAGLTWPTLTFSGRMTLWLGRLEVQQLGHFAGRDGGQAYAPQQRLGTGQTRAEELLTDVDAGGLDQQRERLGHHTFTIGVVSRQEPRILQAMAGIDDCPVIRLVVGEPHGLERGIPEIDAPGRLRGFARRAARKQGQPFRLLARRQVRAHRRLANALQRQA